jgi:hypothetical protein
LEVLPQDLTLPTPTAEHDQQASDNQNQTEHGRLPSSNTLPLILILLIEVTFSTPTGGSTHNHQMPILHSF